jgi:hypothetical protein
MHATKAPAALLPGLLLGFSFFLPACGGGERGGEQGGPPETSPGAEVFPGDPADATRVLRPREGTERDWIIFREMTEAYWAEGLDTLPMGESMVRIGLSLVGTPYEPGTLEPAGEEAVVVNLEAMDCVTFVENVLALARFIRAADPGILQSDLEMREFYRGLLREIRYRGGRVRGYPSRLHYFSEWIRDNEAKGLVREVTRELGGVEDGRAIDFMSSHPEAYRQLGNPANLEAIRETEVRLSRATRYRLPQEEIPTWSQWIENGDIIAATTTVEGLDVAHTGLAYWQGDTLHLLHAPLVGEAVEVSDLPLAERVLRLEGQDGIRVVRPQ